MSRVFSDTATDGKMGWQFDAICSSSAIAGTALWRFRDSITQRIERWGLCSKVGYVCGKETSIVPFNYIHCLKSILWQ